MVKDGLPTGIIKSVTAWGLSPMGKLELVVKRWSGLGWGLSPDGDIEKDGGQAPECRNREGDCPRMEKKGLGDGWQVSA